MFGGERQLSRKEDISKTVLIVLVIEIIALGILLTIYITGRQKGE